MYSDIYNLQAVDLAITMRYGLARLILDIEVQPDKDGRAWKKIDIMRNI